MDMKIQSIHARQILDSRGNPTLEVDLRMGNSVMGRAAVPSGASTGAHEAHELRDGGTKFHGKGVTKAIENIHSKISSALCGETFLTQEELDKALCQLDGSENKKNLGANAILGVSLAYAKARAALHGQELFENLGGVEAVRLPVPLMNVLNGGAHANNGLDVQEFMLVPMCGGRFSEALRVGSEIFHTLKKILQEKSLSTAVGDEGGFAPQLKSNREALELLATAIEKSGYRLGEEVKLALDVASTELFSEGKYTWEGRQLSAEELGEIYVDWSKDFPLFSVEDGFAEDDWSGWCSFTKTHGQRLQLVGDDLFVTNPQRLQRGIDIKAANALLVKVNQIGSLTETIQAVRLAQAHLFRTIMSHRSGETEDVTIADLSVALGCEQIKTGSLCRSERTAKYNQLLRIEEKLGTKAQFWGDHLS